MLLTLATPALQDRINFQFVNAFFNEKLSARNA